MYLFKLCCEKSDAELRKKIGRSQLEFEEQGLDVDFQSNADVFSYSDSNAVNIVVKPEISLEVEDVQFNEEKDTNYATRGDTDTEYEQCKANAIFICNICQRQFIDDAVFKAHQKDHSVKEFVCETCGKEFRKEDLFVQHKIVHTIKTEAQDVKFSAIENIINSEMMSNNRIGFQSLEDLKCLQHNDEFNNQSETVSQKSKYSDRNMPNMLQCNICNKKFKKMAHLTRHMKIHASVKPHTCHLCKKGFARGEQLMNHMNAHSGIKPHVCKICSKGKYSCIICK